MIGYIECEERQTNYGHLLSAYKHHRITRVSPETINNLEVLIVNFIDMNRALQTVNMARLINSKLPVLLVIDIKDYREIHSIISKINGVGRVETIAYTGEKLDRIQEMIESLLHPNLPVKRNEIAFVIPIYNEEERIEHVKSFVTKIKELNDSVVHNLSVYFINDGSSDRSKELIEELIAEFDEESDTVMVKEQFHLHDIKINTKKAGTYIESFKVISEDIIIFADADDGYEFEDIMRMVNLLEQGYYDIVVGTKDLLSENRPKVRRMVSACKRLLTRPFLPKGVTDSQTGLKVFRTALLPYLVPSLDVKYGLAIDLKILHVAKKHDFRVYELPVRFIDRDGSHVDVVKDSLRFLGSMASIIFGKNERTVR